MPYAASRWCLAIIVALALAGCGQLAGPPQDAAGRQFIAYTDGIDLWVVDVDGSNRLRLTSDGASEPYRDPTVAPDGTVYALRGEDTLYRLDLAGRVVGTPVPLGVLENGGEGLAVAPDGQHLAFTTTGWGITVDPRFGWRTGSYIYGGTDVITTDGASVPGAALGSLLYPSWAGNSTVVLSDGVVVYLDTLDAEPVAWLAVVDGCLIPEDCPPGNEPQANLARPVVNRTGTLLAYQYEPYFGTGGRRMASIDEAPPASPTERCLIEGQENHEDPGSLSRDGLLFAFDDTIFDPETFETIGGEGVYVMTVDLDAPDCGASTARLVAPGGYHPDFSPAVP